MRKKKGKKSVSGPSAQDERYIHLLVFNYTSFISRNLIQPAELMKAATMDVAQEKTAAFSLQNKRGVGGVIGG